MEENKIITLFCLIDGFTKRFNTLCFLKQIQHKKTKIRNRKSQVGLSEIITIFTLLHRFNYLFFNCFVLLKSRKIWCIYFLSFLDIHNLLRLIQEAFFSMFCFNQEHLGVCNGMSFIDFIVRTSLKRTFSHSTLKKQIKWGKTITEWFFEFKLHLVMNHQSEIMAFIDDRKLISDMVKSKVGRAFIDKGYISKRFNIKPLREGVSTDGKMTHVTERKLTHLS